MAKKQIFLTTAYTTPYIRVNSFTVDLGDPIFMDGGRDYAYYWMCNAFMDVRLTLCGSFTHKYGVNVTPGT